MSRHQPSNSETRLSQSCPIGKLSRGYCHAFLVFGENLPKEKASFSSFGLRCSSDFLFLLAANPEYATSEIAAKCRVSERTIQRWIKENLLPAQEIMRNRYIVRDEDIERMKPRTIQAHRDTLEQRIDALEAHLTALEHRLHHFDAIETLIESAETRLEALEQAIKELQAKSLVRLHRPPRAEYTVAPPVEGKQDEQETLAYFAGLHGIKESTYKRHAKEIGAHKGYLNKWYVDDASKAAFYETFHNSEGFKRCPDCPHQGKS